MGPARRAVLRFVSLFRSRRAERDLAREIDAHLRLLEDQFIARGMSATDAGYAAKRAFGGVEQAKEHHRDARSFRWLAGWPMDLKLGTRMLVKYPGLTVVAVVALAMAIGAGAAYMEFVSDLLHPTLPYQNGDRIAGIVNWDPAMGNPTRRSLHDFSRWRTEVKSVAHLGAALSLRRNLITEDGRSEPVRGAEITASVFRVIPTPPLLGRVLTPHDERPSAPPVAVIGEDLWQKRFNSDPAILGRAIRLARASYTVVGVMPRSFGFPTSQTLWVPLRTNATDYQRGEGPDVIVFGTLAPGFDYRGAQAELTAIADRMAADGPQGAPRLRPVIKPYVTSMWSGAEDGEMQRLVLYGANLLFLGLLGICGANVATLVFARTVTREAELTVRTALGASRGRIVSQLFAEGLVLASIAAVAGLAIAAFGSRWAKDWFVRAQNQAPPFWWSEALSTETFIYAGLLAFLAAALVGIVPALKATGPQMQARLKSAGAAGPGLRFGGVWTVVIVGQVAVTIVFLMSVVSIGWNAYAAPRAAGHYAFRAEDFLTLRLEMDREATPAANTDAGRAAFRAQFSTAFQEMERRLELEAGVAAVTHTTRLPGKGNVFFVEVDAPDALRSRAPDDPLWVRSAIVGADYFSAWDAPIVSGRTFTPAEAAQARPVAVVDETFVRIIMRGRDPVGLRVRQPQNTERSQNGPWYEIVGVVRDLTQTPNKTSEHAALYLPGPPGAAEGSTTMVVRARGDLTRLPATVGRVGAEADPAMRLYDVRPLTESHREDSMAFEFFLRVLVVVSAVALLLSSAGVYSLLSFTLSRRTREIGIRAALGAAPRRIVTAIFSRAFGQIGLGILAGSVPGFLLVAMGAPEVAQGGGSGLALVATIAVAAFIAGVTALACLVPARRALRIHPTEALRVE